MPKLLRADGYRVVVSRTRDSAVVRLDKGDLVGRVFTASGEHDDLAARVRCANLPARRRSSRSLRRQRRRERHGSETIYDAGRPFAARSRTLAMLLQRDMVAALAARGWRVPDDGVTRHSSGGGEHSSKSVSYGHLFVLGPAMRGYNDHPSDMPGALVEPLFISNPDEGDIAVGAQGQQVLASGIADALEQFLEHSPVPTPHPGASASPTTTPDIRSARRVGEGTGEAGGEGVEAVDEFGGSCTSKSTPISSRWVARPSSELEPVRRRQVRASSGSTVPETGVTRSATTAAGAFGRTTAPVPVGAVVDRRRGVRGEVRVGRLARGEPRAGRRARRHPVHAERAPVARGRCPRPPGTSGGRRGPAGGARRRGGVPCGRGSR